jgi:Na+/H+ antiporter NhaD/arsenite permease-like protein
MPTIAEAFPSLMAAAAGPMSGGSVDYDLPMWTVAPFVILLLGIAILPLAAHHFWESNRNKLIFSLLCGLPVGIYMWWKASTLHVAFTLHDHPVLSAMHEYSAFLLLLFALFVISGGIYVRGTLAGTPNVNTMFLAIGGVIASIVGTTGASMLLIRPLLRANALRKRKAHVVIFFIFVVANCGGLLTPLGDPPLFLGFLKGVPFTWTFALWKQWLVINGALLVIFHFLDSYFFHREDVEERADLDEAVEKAREKLGIEGGANFLLLGGVIAAIYCSGRFHWPVGVQEGAMLALALASVFTTQASIRTRNEFSYGPILEVAALFIGIFLAMIPALKILNAEGPDLGVDTAREFYWATGALSSSVSSFSRW